MTRSASASTKDRSLGSKGAGAGPRRTERPLVAVGRARAGSWDGAPLAHAPLPESGGGEGRGRCSMANRGANAGVHHTSKRRPNRVEASSKSRPAFRLRLQTSSTSRPKRLRIVQIPGPVAFQGASIPAPLDFGWRSVGLGFPRQTPTPSQRYLAEKAWYWSHAGVHSRTVLS